jgi:5-methylcytosine-specific restriction protein A
MHAQDEFEYSIDVPENIVALCPNCHRQTHLSENKERFKIVNKLFKIIKQRNLSDRNIEITLEKLLEYYQL